MSDFIVKALKSVKLYKNNLKSPHKKDIKILGYSLHARPTSILLHKIVEILFKNKIPNAEDIHPVYLFYWCIHQDMMEFTNDLYKDMWFFGLLYKMKDQTLFHILTNFQYMFK